MEREADDRTEDLLAGHVEWVRALARRLASDDASADDLAQDALVVALRSGPRASLKFRPWIAAVMRNLVRQEARGSARRETREERAARPEAGDRLVDEVVAGRELAQAVLDLPEPYRSAVLLRFWEGLPPRAIAERLDVPVATVNSRLARGLARLRERYDGGERDDTDRGRRLAALAPLLDTARTGAHAASGWPALSLGGFVLNAKLVISGAAAAALAAVLWGIAATRDADAPRADGAARAESPAKLAQERTPELALEARAGGGTRSPESAPIETKPAPASAPALDAAHSVSGLLFDAEGLPLGGLVVGSSSDSGPAKSGRFAFETRAASLALSVRDPGWVTVREGAWTAGSELEPVVVAARELAVAGEVVDARGDPIQDARVQLVLPSAFPTRFGTSLESSRSRDVGTTSDAQGRFLLASLPQISGARLRAVREGWRTADLPAPPGSDPALRIVMTRPEIPLTGAVRGTVVDDRGDPVPEARVFLGLASTTTDERGRFGLDLARAVTSDRIGAVKPGLVPAFLDRPREPHGAETGWPDPLVLVLGGEPLTIRGVVRDHAGNPRTGLRVSIADPTAIGVIGRMPATAEGLASGALLPPAAVESEFGLPERDADHYNDMTMRAGAPSAFWNHATTDAEGRFEIGGLLDRRYRLRVADPKSLLAHTTPPIPAGERSAEVKLPEPDVWPEVHGVLVDDEGAPLAGVQVEVDTEAYGVRARFFGGRVYVSLRDQGQRTTSDAEGRFVLRDVPREGMTLQISSERVVPRDFTLGPDTDPARVEIEVATRCSFEASVAIGTEPYPDAIGLQDGRGDRLDVLRIESGSVNAYTSAPLVEGRTGVLSASSAARTLLLLRDEQVLRAVPIRLRAGATNRIEL